jgi:hypothetical protein
MPDDLDRLKLELEERKVTSDIQARQHELELKNKELELKQQELERSRHSSISVTMTAIIAGLLSLITAGITSYLGGIWSLKAQKEKNDGELILLREKSQREVQSQNERNKSEVAIKEQERQFQILLKATENRTPQEAAKNLLFFVDIGYLPDPSNKIREKAKAGEVPTITSLIETESIKTRRQTTGPLGEKIDYIADRAGNVQFEGYEQNIVTIEVPQLKFLPGFHKNGNIQIYKEAAKDLLGAFSDIESAGLLHLVLSWDGSYVPRTKRGSSVLSEHAKGIAFDINSRWNTLGRKPVPEGEKGSVVKLVPIFKKHGFKWGGELSRPEGNHFQWSKGGQ